MKKFISEHPICFTIIMCCLFISLIVLYIIDPKQSVQLIQIILIFNILGLVVKYVLE